MHRVLVIVLGETRAHELTFDNFKVNVLDVLNADLCLCIGVTKDYDYGNPFYKHAKYKFLYDEKDDYSDPFQKAYRYICSTRQLEEPHVYWRDFLKIKDQFLGGIKDKHHQHPGSAGILIFFRWYLHQHILFNNMKDKYDRFIITRSDFLYQLPHPKLNLMSSDYIWFPDCEYYRGYTDRHVILSNKNIDVYLSIFEAMVVKSHTYFQKMINTRNWNLEKLIKFHLHESKCKKQIRVFPYIMFSVRNINGTTRYSKGTFCEKLKCYIKYASEYNKSTYYAKKYAQSGLLINDFYRKFVK